MPTVIATATLSNGLRNDFDDTYALSRKALADSRLANVMDLSIGATNRQHEFAYYKAPPHMQYWRRGDPIPEDAMDSVQFSVPIFEWAMRVKWLKWDRKDDQTQSLMERAQGAGESAGLLPLRFFMDLLTGTANDLPAIPLAPDGAALYSTTDGGGGARFGATNGNLLTGTGVLTTSAIKADYYSGIAQWKAMQDGKGQPLLREDIIDRGVLIIHASGNEEVFEESFLQKRQGIVLGTDAGTTPSNVVQDASRNVKLWSSNRLTGNDWFMFLLEPPKKPTFLMNREGIQEFSSLEGDNNSDFTRTTATEYIQWEERSGAGIALPYGTVKINN